jgi:hypothetical protein
MVGVLSDLYSIDEPDSFSLVKVTPRFNFHVAPDVDADQSTAINFHHAKRQFNS